MNTYIARLTDRGSLSEPIVWRTNSIAEARELLVNVGAWQTAPGPCPEHGMKHPEIAHWDCPGVGQILLSDSAYVEIFDDVPPFRTDDDLGQRIEDGTPRVIFDRGPRGGIRRVTF